MKENNSADKNKESNLAIHLKWLYKKPAGIPSLPVI